MHRLIQECQEVIFHIHLYFPLLSAIINRLEQMHAHDITPLQYVFEPNNGRNLWKLIFQEFFEFQKNTHTRLKIGQWDTFVLRYALLGFLYSVLPLEPESILN